MKNSVKLSLAKDIRIGIINNKQNKFKLCDLTLYLQLKKLKIVIHELSKIKVYNFTSYLKLKIVINNLKQFINV